LGSFCVGHKAQLHFQLIQLSVEGLVAKSDHRAQSAQNCLALM
jgi:hypothetical protein